MDGRRKYLEFVDALAHELGIELTPDVDGWVGIDCGLDLEVAIGYGEATDGVVFLAPFRALTARSVDAWAKRALAFNLENLRQADGHFALDPDSLSLIFQREIRITDLGADELIDLLAAFLARFRELAERLSREEIEAETGGPPEDDETAALTAQGRFDIVRP